MINLQPFRTLAWLKRAFGSIGTTDKLERLLRLGEETIELMQAEGVTQGQALALVKQVYGKPVGDPDQELGGVMVTLASYCAVTGRDPERAFNTEFERVETPEMIEKIRRKHDSKAVVSSEFRRERTPTDQPVPGVYVPPASLDTCAPRANSIERVETNRGEFMDLEILGSR